MKGYPVMRYRLFLLQCFLLLSAASLCAQDEYPEYEANRPIEYYYRIVDGDTLFFGQIGRVTIFPPLKFKNNREYEEYVRMINDVKRTLPYAKAVSVAIEETYQFMLTLPGEKERQKMLEDTKKFVMDTYKPRLKKLNRRQGGVLIKLIDRECNSASYFIVKSIVGSFQAGFYNLFAGLFGNSLKTRYNPKGEDKMLERIVIQVEEGVL